MARAKPEVILDKVRLLGWGLAVLILLSGIRSVLRAVEVIISMDGDLQHDPEEIPAFLAKLAKGYDIVSGWRAERRDHWLTRRLPSRIANWMMARLARVPLHDFGTTFRGYRREIIQSIPLYGELHRFIPALPAWSGARLGEGASPKTVNLEVGTPWATRKRLGKRRSNARAPP
jgi:glycosyltransferase involved in cell wall biosynthesis